MIVRNCAGGVVFCGDEVLVIENDKHEWAFPKGIVRPGANMIDVAKERVNVECGVDASVLVPCGKTHYEFYSVTRRKPIHNNISWFIMKCDKKDISLDPEQGIVSAKFVPVDDALELITYSQDRTLFMMAYQRYKEITS
ncbi:MAG: NUDIX domain-containing protein [Saccharofermentans sp.]|nr:NUDIX domain-containing protein [Saccharofermentans sp.]